MVVCPGWCVSRERVQLSSIPSSLEQIFEPGGLLDAHLEHYEFRPSQLKMAGAVLEVIRERGHLCVEAGTGTGKTLSYLIPALFSKKRVIVSTATKNLQEQIFSKDIPFIRTTLMPGLKATYMKGRQNYLCLRRYEEFSRQRMLPGADELVRMLAEWLGETETGDRAELVWLDDSMEWWNDIDARSDTCAGQKCPHYDDCFVTRMRRRAIESDIIVVNHALFFANLALESDEIGKILPDFSVAILDEAHEIEDVAAVHFGRRLSSFQFEDLGRTLRRSSMSGRPASLALVDRLERSCHRFFSRFPVVEGRHSLNFYSCPDTGQVLDLRATLAKECRGILEALEALFHDLEVNRSAGDESDAALRRVDSYFDILEQIFNLEDENSVYWFERGARAIFLHITPINIAGLLRDRLFDRTDSSVLTSATLTTDSGFAYIKERTGVPDPVELAVPGEFDYQRQAVLYVPSRFPEPRSPEYPDRFLRDVNNILRLTDGHAFLLFTSIRQMRAVYESFAVRGDYPVLCQGQRPRSVLLEEFKATPRAVLCATSSFWQGVDVQGEALRAVVIDKLPFQVPTEPLVAARLHRLRQEGRDPFLNYTIPTAIITLRQGIGRLIRSRRDRGILAIMDSRIWSKRYGNLFLNSLPNCPVADNIENLENFYSRIVSNLTGGR